MAPPPSKSRKRSADDTSSQQSSNRRSKSDTSAFSRGSARAYLTNFYGSEKCFHCEATQVQLAHIFAVVDTNFADCRILGFTGLRSKGDFLNALWLCASCHTAYDKQWKPQLVIVPCDLDFFEQYEILCQNNMRTHNQPRRPPTVDEYERSCGEGAGLYICYTDENFLSPHTQIEPQPKRCHADPMAILYRAMNAAVQIIHPLGLPRKIHTRLCKLQALFAKGNILQARIHDSTETGPSMPPTDGAHDEQNPHDDNVDPASTPRSAAGSSLPGPPSAGQAPSLQPNNHASYAAPGIPSPATPAIPATHKRKRACNDVQAHWSCKNMELGTSSVTLDRNRHKRARDDEQDNECPHRHIKTETLTSASLNLLAQSPAVAERSGRECVLDMFLQSLDSLPSTDTAYPLEAGNIDANDSISLPEQHSDRASTFPPNDCLTNGKQYWQWKGNTAQDAIDWKRAVFELTTRLSR